MSDSVIPWTEAITTSNCKSLENCLIFFLSLNVKLLEECNWLYDINESEHLLHASYVLITALSLLHLLMYFMWCVLILTPLFQW